MKDQQINMPAHSFKKNFPEMELPRLIKELQNLNGKDYKNLEKILQNVYNKLIEIDYKQDRKKVFNFDASPVLEEQDLIVLCQGVYEVFQYYPRPVQLISVFELFHHSNNQGRLAQIYTGEGKTLIVAMLAVLIAKKKNNNVDIITSSPVLAKRDAEELSKFYTHFKLKVSHNINKEDSDNNLKPCYQSNIVYGDSHSFEADILLHEYSELGTKGDRKDGYAIVDEVDSMLIDGVGHSTILSSPIPGMLDISKILILIWDEICKVEKSITKDRKLLIVKQDEIYQVDLQEYIEKTLDLQIQDAIGKLMLPYRLEYIKFMKKTWIDNAIYVKFCLQENQNYVIDNGQVRIVDYQNTGVIHKDNMQWQQGTHQFVQLKHKLNLTPIGVSTNFMSNVCFFKRYSGKILGLTGTLGSQYTKNLLSKQYNVDFILIPPNKPRQLKEQLGNAVSTETEWLEQITKDVELQISKGRAVLLINKTINDVKKISEKFEQKGLTFIVYTDDSQDLNKNISEKEIVIATNLAGRGTDLITNEGLEKNGGLHVIVTFLPRNIRIQEQAFGRTARQGKTGTAKLIVQTSNSFYLSKEQKLLDLAELIELCKTNKLNTNQEQLSMIHILKYYRDQNEQINMNEIDEKMLKLMHEDECFQTFCQAAKSLVDIKEEPARFKSLEEKWGLYLEQHKETGLDKNEIQLLVKEDQCKNPKYLIMQGLQEDQVSYLNEASSLNTSDPAAMYYKGCLQLKKLDSQSINQGVQSLLYAKQLFQEKIDNENGCHLAFRLNRMQIQQFQMNDEQEDLQMKNRSDQSKQQINLNEFENPKIFQPLFQNLTLDNIQKQEQIIPNTIQNQKQQSKMVNQKNFNQQQQQNVQNSQYQNFMKKETFESLNRSQTQKKEKRDIYKNTELQEIKDKSTIENQNLKKKQSFQDSQIQQLDIKLQNQIQVYQKFIQNIEDIIQTLKSFNQEEEVLEFEWISSLSHNLSKKNVVHQSQQKFGDKLEVIQDGPLPKMGKLYKKKKQKSFFSRFCMFLLGLLQIAIGSLICAFSCGICYVIGTWLIKEGFNDLLLAFNDIPIDWGEWGKDKVVSFCATLSFAGQMALKESFDLSKDFFKTLTKVTLIDVIINTKNISFQVFNDMEVWVSKQEAINIQKQYDVIREIANQSDMFNKQDEIQLMAQYLLHERVRGEVISQQAANDIADIVKQALKQSTGTSQFKNNLFEISKKFLKIQMAKFKSSQSDENQKNSIKEVYDRRNSLYQQDIKFYVDTYKKDENCIRTGMTNFSKFTLDAFYKDSEIQRQLIGLDLYYEKFSDQNKVKSILTSVLFQKILYGHSVLGQQVEEEEIVNLELNSQRSVELFYQKHIGTIIQKCITEISNEKIIEPLTILLYSELIVEYKQILENVNLKQQDLINQQKQLINHANDLKLQWQKPTLYELENVRQMIEQHQIRQTQYQTELSNIQQVNQYDLKQICISLINQIKIKGLIYQDGISCNLNLKSEFNILVSKSNYCQIFKQILQTAMMKSLWKLRQIKYKNQGLFSKPFIQAIEQELIYSIEGEIFEQKMAALDRKMLQQMKSNHNI